MIGALRFFFKGEDWSGPVTNEARGVLFLFVEMYAGLLVAWLKVVRMPLVCVENGLFDPEAVISLKICLEVPIFWLPPDDDRGLKKRVKVLGVIVDFFLGFLKPWLLESGSKGDDGGDNSCVGFSFLSV